MSNAPYSRRRSAGTLPAGLHRNSPTAGRDGPPPAGPTRLSEWAEVLRGASRPLSIDTLLGEDQHHGQGRIGLAVGGHRSETSARVEHRGDGGVPARERWDLARRMLRDRSPRPSPRRRMLWRDPKSKQADTWWWWVDATTATRKDTSRPKGTSLRRPGWRARCSVGGGHGARPTRRTSVSGYRSGPRTPGFRRFVSGSLCRPCPG
jgi:hypothetical protein